MQETWWPEEVCMLAVSCGPPRVCLLRARPGRVVLSHQVAIKLSCRGVLLRPRGSATRGPGGFSSRSSWSPASSSLSLSTSTCNEFSLWTLITSSSWCVGSNIAVFCLNGRDILCPSVQCVYEVLLLDEGTTTPTSIPGRLSHCEGIIPDCAQPTASQNWQARQTGALILLLHLVTRFTR